MLMYIGLTLLFLVAFAMLLMFGLLIASLSAEARVPLYLYFGVLMACTAWPIHGFLVWWALVTLTPLAIEALRLAEECWCAFCHRHDAPPEPVVEKPKKTSRRFLDWQHAFDHLVCNYPGLKSSDAEHVKKLAMLMYFGWVLVEVVETEHCYRVHIQRGDETKKLIIVRCDATSPLLEELGASSPV